MISYEAARELAQIIERREATAMGLVNLLHGAADVPSPAPPVRNMMVSLAAAHLRSAADLVEWGERWLDDEGAT